MEEVVELLQEEDVVILGCIREAARNRPAHLGAGALPANRDPAFESAARQLLAAGLAPETVAAAA